ncbi:uncharacterized protein METZ01_LOCUS222943, partial [marine metagenome]
RVSVVQFYLWPQLIHSDEYNLNGNPETLFPRSIN